jgi:hypothetical protein
MDPTLDSSLGVLPGTTGAVDPSSALGIAGSAGIASGVGAGQQGIVPLIGGTGSVSDAVDDVWEWLNTPFSSPMSPWVLMLMLGVILVGIIFWNLVLYHIRIAAETI